MRYENYNRDGIDKITSHYIYDATEFSVDFDETDLLDFLEENGVDISKVEYVEFEPIPGRHIFHETK